MMRHAVSCVVSRSSSWRPHHQSVRTVHTGAQVSASTRELTEHLRGSDHREEGMCTIRETLYSLTVSRSHIIPHVKQTGMSTAPATIFGYVERTGSS